MLRVFLALLVFIPLACSSDRPAPVAPAGKAASVKAAPPAPQNLHVEALSDTSALVAWDSAEGATDYDINYKQIGGKWKNWPHRASPLYSTIYGLEPNTVYRWAVRAENRDGPSRWVFGSNFKTLPLLPTQQEEDFQIELVFVSAFTAEQERWIREVATGWERFFYGLEDTTFSSGETILEFNS